MKQLFRLLLSAFLFVHILIANGQDRNGFDLSDASVPVNEILQGGPPRDGIPSIDTPRFVDVESAHYIQPSDPVLGISHNNVRKAYPVSILNWHEIVNDEFSGEPVVITYCPLCGTGIAYLATTGKQVLKFGVSGLLYNSDMLLYDRQTHSLWTQIGKRAISGEMKGQQLQAIPLIHTSWEDWHTLHPDTLVLSTDTGYSRNYMRSPYSGYKESRALYFPVQYQDKRFHPKEDVLGVELNGHYKAYPFTELEKTKATFTDYVGRKIITIKYSTKHRKAEAFDSKGKILPAVKAYWFAWVAFHPETEVFQSP